MAETEWEKWQTILPGQHWLDWKPVGYPVQEYACYDGMLFNIATANASGYCQLCREGK